jgi:hypothetical protein
LRIRIVVFFVLLSLTLHAEQRPKSTPKKATATEQPAAAKPGVDRHYYIAAEDVDWDFAPSQRDLIHNSPLRRMWVDRTKWKKTRYIEYTDDSFTTQRPQPAWLGVLGPVIRAEVGDTVYVHFLNKSRIAHSIHAHGVRYNKESEGAHYAFRGAGAQVVMGQKFVYTWLVRPESGPAPGESSSRVWLYHGHVDEPEETNAGLIGPIIITAKGKAKPDATPVDVDREFVVLFMMFDQSPSPPPGTRRSQLQFVLPEYEFSAMNGYIFGNLQGLVMREGERVRWHVMAMGSESDLHTPHWHGHTVTAAGHTKDVTQLLPATTETLDMVADNVGSWMLQCHVADHMDEGMMTYYTVLPKERSCPVDFAKPEFGKDGAFAFDVINREPAGDMAIARMINKVEIVPKRYQTATLFAEEGDVAALAAGATTRRQIAGGFVGGDQALGFIVRAEKIVFANGEVWEARYRGECARGFFKDPKDAFDTTVLPPDRTGEDDEFEDH